MGIAPAPFGKMYVPLMVIAAIATKITLDGYYEQCFLSADRNSYKGALTHSVFYVMMRSTTRTTNFFLTKLELYMDCITFVLTTAIIHATHIESIMEEACIHLRVDLWLFQPLS